MRLRRRLLLVAGLVAWATTFPVRSGWAQRSGPQSPPAAEAIRVLADANELLRAAEIAVGTDRMQLLDRARDHFGELLFKFPGYPDAMFGLAEVSRLQERWNEARDEYNAYIDTPGGVNDFRAYEGLGRVYLASKYFRMALPKFRKATELNAASASAWDGLAESLLGVREIESAYAAGQQAVALQPNNVEVLETVALVCKESVSELAEGRLNTKNPEWLDEGLRASNRAVSVLRAEWEKAPESPLPLEQIDKFYDTMIKLYEYKLRVEKDAKPEHVLQLVQSLNEQQEVKKLLSLYTSLRLVNGGIKVMGPDMRLLIRAAELEKSLGMTRACRETCEKILKLEPGNSQAQSLLDSLSK